jgi:hypothetical protein
MPGPVAPIVIRPVAAGDEQSAVNVDQLRAVIAMVEAAGGVVDTGQVFQVNDLVLDTLGSGYRQLVASAVARANCDPVVAASRKVGPEAAGLEGLGPKIEEVGKKIAAAAAMSRRYSMEPARGFGGGGSPWTFRTRLPAP